MPKKKTAETQEAQSERFREAVRAAVAAGELNPTEADNRFDTLVDKLLRFTTQATPNESDI